MIAFKNYQNCYSYFDSSQDPEEYDLGLLKIAHKF